MKKLENEYRQLMQSETPDLWSRIEAGIDAKIAAADEAENNVAENNVDAERTETLLAESDELENVVELDTKKTGNRKVVRTGFWKKYSLPLVACIAALFCVPLVLTGFIRMAGGGAKSADTAMDTAAAEEYYYSTTTEAADEPAAVFDEEVMEEAVEEESDSDDCVMDEMTDDCFDAEMVETEEAATENSVEDTAVTESVPAEEETESFMKENQPEDGEKSITLTVIAFSRGIEDFAETEELREEGIIYYMTTKEQGDCTVFVPADQNFEPDTYQLLEILVEPGNEEYDYFFVGVAE